MKTSKWSKCIYLISYLTFMDAPTENILEQIPFLQKTLDTPYVYEACMIPNAFSS